jgi:hypothetical protein
MIRTNAFGGATISYKAEQNNSSGKLKVLGAACSGTSSTDQCFNNAVTTDNFTNTAGERFGMSLNTVLRPTGSTTTNLTRSATYSGNGTPTANFEWDDSGAAVQIASSSTVMDYEMLVLNFAARAAATTPTGAYQVISTYIATATF